jgi:hypothetical protein
VNRLKEQGVVNNKKNYFISKIGERLVQEAYSGKRADSGIQKY